MLLVHDATAQIRGGCAVCICIRRKMDPVHQILFCPPLATRAEGIAL